MLPEGREPTSPFYISASAIGVQSRPHVLKRVDAFAVLDRFGNFQAFGPAAEGLFFEDTRYLSQLILTVDGLPPVLLSSTVNEDNTMLIADFTNAELTSGCGKIPRDTVHFLSSTALHRPGLSQRVRVRNFGKKQAVLAVRFNFDADFADIFEVRGVTRPRRGIFLPDECTAEGMDIVYLGLDKVERRTRVLFTPKPTALESRAACWQLALGAGEEQVIELKALCRRNDREAPEPVSHETGIATAIDWLRYRKKAVAGIFTSNVRFNHWLDRSRADVDMLVTETPQGPYAYAGIPWFSTAFGRDGIITALECLWLDPLLAAGTLRFLAANQATELDPRADAEPGKILHETRKGEMAALGEVPFGRYYGSVDATPLFIVLAAAYYERTGNIGLIRALWPNIEAAVAWMRKYGDLDGDGFIEYDRRSVNGLINQGWKDSADSIFHAGGYLAEAPIALAEVQAYAYAAYRGAASLARALANRDGAAELERAAASLRERFEATFWLEEMGTYALALDGAKRPCRVRSSNAGHVLFGGLASPERARRVAALLTAEQSFSGWGIRTIAEGEARYNPISYHNGSIWPHDNALIAMGFSRYGLKRPLMQVLSGLFDATSFLDLHRLPELFCGFPRRTNLAPTEYPVACVPQAWSSAAAFGMLGAALGVSFDAEAGRVIFNQPVLPPSLGECQLSNLRVGQGWLDLQLLRSQDDVAIHVLRREGPVEIVVVV